MITYRNMKVTDIHAGLSLCRHAGWNQLSRDWELFLKLSPNGCRVAIDEKNVIGTVTTVRYENHFSWIGMVLVNPASRKLGIGTQLLREALQILNEEETIKLDATPAGRKVYLKLDFKYEYNLSRMVLTNVPSGLQNSSGTKPERRDLPEIIKYDRKVFGAERSEILQWMIQGVPQYAFVIREADKIKGYCFGRPGFRFAHIGPVVARSATDAIHLVSAALQNCAGQAVILDIPHHSSEWMRWLTSIGFVEQRPFIRMYRGINRYPGIPENQFAILGPEFG